MSYTWTGLITRTQPILTTRRRLLFDSKLSNCSMELTRPKAYGSKFLAPTGSSYHALTKVNAASLVEWC